VAERSEALLSYPATGAPREAAGPDGGVDVEVSTTVGRGPAPHSWSMGTSVSTSSRSGATWSSSTSNCAHQCLAYMQTTKWVACIYAIVMEVTDTEIESAIERNDDADHPDAYSVAEVRSALYDVTSDVLEYWDLHEDAIDDGALEVVHEDDDVLVLADHSGHFWTEQFDALDIEDEHDIMVTIVSSLHHTAARKHCDHSWSVTAPVVVDKTELFATGEAHVLREVARRTEEFGSVARAVDSLAVDVHGWSKSMWADLTDRNASTVTRTTDN